MYVILDNPFGEGLAPRSLLDRGFFHTITISLIPLSKAAAIERTEPTRSAIRTIAQENGAAIIDPIEFLCADTCPALAPNGVPLYKDYDHLSEYALTRDVHYLDFLAQPSPAE